MKALLILAALVAIPLSGCSRGPYEVVPVSGVVTLAGEPLEGATVSFLPLGAGKEVVGPGSVGITDASGTFKLRTFKDERGAVVANHTVRISTFKSKFKDLKTSDKLEVVSKERVPPKYNRNTELTFEVPSGGTDKANFELASQ